MHNKTHMVRNHVLELLEQGRLKTGDQVPAAREVALKLGISFLKVQQAIDSLCREGVLDSYSRKGTFVQQGWEERILPENVSVYNQLHRLPWLPEMLDVTRHEFPEMRMTHVFKKGMLELKTTRHALTEHNEYMDLREIFDECYPDHSVFFEKMFKVFEINGRVVGIPFAFSPRVVFFNPSLFERAGCEVPRGSWSWEECVRTVRKLRKVLPADRIINWHTQSYLWINFILRAGGHLFEPGKADPVAVDSPATQRALEYFSELGDLVDRVRYDDDGFQRDFLRGKAAMIIGDRKQAHLCRRGGFEDWGVLPLPQFPGGKDIMAQATDLICVRKACTSRSLAIRYVRMMLSEAVQEFIGSQKCCIPIRKDSACRSIDLTDPRDAVFASEMEKMSTDFNLVPPFPVNLVLQGIQQLLDRRIDLKKGLGELGQVARTYVSIYGQDRGLGPSSKSVFSGRGKVE